MTKPTYEQLEAHLNKCQSQRARLENQLSERDRQVTLLREAMQGAWKDGYCFVGPEGQTDEQKAFEQALAATEPKEN